MKGFVKYYGKRVLWYALTLVCALILNFALPRMMPGNPVDTLVAEATAGVTDSSTIAQIREEYIERFGLDKSYVEQFFIYVGNLFQGDMGTSFTYYPKSVNEVIGSAVGWTIALQLPAILVGWFLGNLLGAVSAYIKKGFDKAIMPFFMFLSSFPAFGLAYMFIWFCAVKTNIFPSGGAYSFEMIPHASLDFVFSVIYHYQMPFWTMVLIAIGGQALGMRSMSIYELNADYVKYSRFLGISDRKIVKYVFRNAMLPQITGLCLSLGTMVGGNLVAEVVFSYPGIGSALLASISNRDYPLLSGCTLIITCMVLVANLVLEVLYGFIDPRIKANQNEE